MRTPAPPGVAWIVLGAPGSGKSTLARALARRLPALLIDRDVATAPLTRVVARQVGAAPDDLDDPRVLAALSDAAYDAVLDLAADNLRLGHTVLVVAPFTRALSTPEAVGHVRARLASASLHVVLAECLEPERRRRLAARGAPRDRRKLLARRLEPGPTPAVAHARVDTTAPLAEQVGAALAAPVVGPS